MLALTGGIGVKSEVRDGVYTGEPDGPFTYREGKVTAIKDLADEEGFDLAGATPTPTASRTCRCCAPSATRWP